MVFSLLLTCGNFFSGSTRLNIAKTNAAVLPVPDCDCAIKFCGGSANNVGKAVSWIFDGALKPISYTPFSKFGFLKTPNYTTTQFPFQITHNRKASKLFTEYKGDEGSLRWISISFLFSTKPFRIAFCNRLASAGLNCSATLSSVGFLFVSSDSFFEISTSATWKILRLGWIKSCAERLEYLRGYFFLCF